MGLRGANLFYFYFFCAIFLSARSVVCPPVATPGLSLTACLCQLHPCTMTGRRVNVHGGRTVLTHCRIPPRHSGKSSDKEDSIDAAVVLRVVRHLCIFPCGRQGKKALGASRAESTGGNMNALQGVSTLLCSAELQTTRAWAKQCGAASYVALTDPNTVLCAISYGRQQ